MKAVSQHFVTYQPLRLKTQAVNRWLVSGTTEEPMKFVPVTMEGEVNTWLLQGFSIHENPCRKDFVEGRRIAASISVRRAAPSAWA